MAQSPLSQQIRKLEEELGLQLFNRNSRRVELTHAGRVYLDEARKILAQGRRAAQRAKDADIGRVGSLTVGYLTSMTNERFSGIMTAFREDCPEVDLKLNDLIPDAIYEALRERRIDVGFLRAAFKDEELDARKVWQDTLMVALPRNHWLAGKGLVAARSLKEETFVMVPDRGSMGLNETTRTLCLRAGFAPKRKVEANQLQAAIWLVHLGFGISIVPASLQGLHRDNVVYQPILRTPILPAFMVWRRDNDSPALARFRDLVSKLLKKAR